MYKGYELALKTNQAVSFTFFDVVTTLQPDQQQVDDNMIEIRINDVLKEIRKKSHVSLFLYNTNDILLHRYDAAAASAAAAAANKTRTVLVKLNLKLPVSVATSL